MSPHPPGREAGRMAAPATYEDAAAWLRERYPDIGSGLLFAQDADPRLNDAARWAFAAALFALSVLAMGRNIPFLYFQF